VILPAKELAMLSIRPAVAGDVAILNTLVHEFAEFERLPIAATEAGLLRDGFSDSPKFRVLIAEWEGEAAGYALFFGYYSSFEGRAGLFLEGHLRSGPIPGEGDWQEVAGPHRADRQRTEVFWRAVAGAGLEYSRDRVL
jgi:hypothetical protein